MTGFVIALGFALGAVAIVAVVGLVRIGGRREERWRNAELFLPHAEPVALGGVLTARYRGRTATPEGADGATIVAELRCEEILHGADRREQVLSQPLEVVVYSRPGLVEADIIIAVPAEDAVPSLETDFASVRWMVSVSLDAGDGTRAEVTRSLEVAPVVAL